MGKTQAAAHQNLRFPKCSKKSQRATHTPYSQYARTSSHACNAHQPMLGAGCLFWIARKETGLLCGTGSSQQFHKPRLQVEARSIALGKNKKKRIFSCKIIPIKLRNWLSLHLGELGEAPQGSSAPVLPQHEVPDSRSSGPPNKFTSCTAALCCEAARQPLP